MLKALGTVASPWGSQGKGCRSEITHMFTDLAPLGRGSRGKENGENVSMSLESSVILSPQSTSWALEGLIREESCTAMGDGMEAASVHAHLCLFYCISFQSAPPRPRFFLG